MRLPSLTQSPTEQIVGLPGLSIVCEREGDVHTITLDGELEIATAPRLERELRRIEATDPDRILVDLRDVSFVDSTGIRTLLTAAARSRDGDRLVLRRPNVGMLRVLRLAGVADLLPLQHGARPTTA